MDLGKGLWKRHAPPCTCFGYVAFLQHSSSTAELPPWRPTAHVTSLQVSLMRRLEVSVLQAQGSRAGRRTASGVSPEQSRGGRITSLALLATLLGMQPRIQLAFRAVSAHCWVMLSFSSTSTPNSFLAWLLSIPHPPACIYTGGCPEAGEARHESYCSQLRYFWSRTDALRNVSPLSES